ncbi:MAG: DUF3380 domain-containing protein [Paraglaciecola sp.]|nr:DUF3380 domain-containing protein [Paraglaciecola sp.]NCT47277.1 DUF3380 domain-containing protein [Paraglaciecola sp.]
MLGAVSTSKLNVRSLPKTSSTVLGQLTEGMVISGSEAHDGWVQLDYANTFGFVCAHYLQPVNDLARLTGTVNSSRLNIRKTPNIGGKLLATVNRGASIKTLAVQGDWLEIEFNGETAYTAAKYVDLVYVSSGYYAIVTAGILNVRTVPQRNAALFGQLSQQTQVWVEGKQLGWSQIRFNGNRGYVLSDYLQVSEPPVDRAAAPIALADQHSAAPLDTDIIPKPDASQKLSRLTPTTILTVAGNSEQRAVAATWNRWGALLQELSDTKQLDVACAVAVLCVESSGKGFEQNNSDKLIIRFENHKFWTYWGQHNPQQFRQHFRYNPDKVWTEHQWRREPLGDWQAFHGRQSAEWQAFDFACQLDAEAAMLSISMGAPQIMGFHFERIGYQSVTEMFNAFSSSIQSQINGLFDFFSPTMLRYLRDGAFKDFAGMYNGKGQKQIYGDKIQQHYAAFKKLLPNQP